VAALILTPAAEAAPVPEADATPATNLVPTVTFGVVAIGTVTAVPETATTRNLMLWPVLTAVPTNLRPNSTSVLPLALMVMLVLVAPSAE
jgi:hypothetical protein